MTTVPEEKYVYDDEQLIVGKAIPDPTVSMPAVLAPDPATFKVYQPEPEFDKDNDAYDDLPAMTSEILAKMFANLMQGQPAEHEESMAS